MNHGGYGLLDKEGNLTISPEILDALSLGEGSTIYGVYYPKKKNDKRYKKVTIDHDFMLTPIPHELWPRCARLIIYLRQEPGSLKVISKFLKRKGVSIIHSESTRSAYRYATWSLFISFSKKTIPDNKLKYDPKKQNYNFTNDCLDNLVKDIQKDKLCQKHLFTDDSDSIDAGNPVIGYCVGELAYFNNILVQNIENSYDLGCLPFELNLKYFNGIPKLISSSFTQIIEDQILQKDTNTLPAFVYSELDTRNLNLRLALIPEETRGRRFFEVGIEYTWTKHNKYNRSECVGLLAEITEQSHKSYSLWRSFNYTKVKNKTSEKGCIVLIIEDIDLQKSDDHYNNDIKIYVDKLKSLDLINKGIVTFINSPEISQLSRLKINLRLEKTKLKIDQTFKYDFFISYKKGGAKDKISGDEEFVQKLETILKKNKIDYFIDNFIGTGNIFEDEIKQAIIDSREFLIICSPSSMRSQWVTTEWGAAWGFNKQIIPICIKNVKTTKLPDRLGRRNAIIIKDINDDQIIGQKLIKLINDMSIRKYTEGYQRFDRKYI